MIYHYDSNSKRNVLYVIGIPCDNPGKVEFASSSLQLGMFIEASGNITRNIFLSAICLRNLTG